MAQRGEHIFLDETFIPRPRRETFAFFADADNLERITPPELRFEIQTPRPIGMHAGTRIEYRLRLFGVPFRWSTLISTWQPDEMFVDEQLRGPYAQWIHTHRFLDAHGGTRVTDEVRYRLPLYPLGEVGYPLVRRQVTRIFAYRGEQLRQLLGSPDSSRG
jgi:ligand-binding SRPBCC domain-containing protein